MTHTPQRDFVSVTYDEKSHPYTEYPDKLARYLVERYQLPSESSILDLGCGRGEFLRGFIRCGLNGYGVDRSPASKDMDMKASFTQSNLEHDPLPYDDNTFDCIFSKSVLEHFYYPEKLSEEIFRITKPEGRIIIMIPDWESQFKRAFYADYTHRTPFTVASLRSLLLVTGFDSVQVEKFRQLPLLWKYPWLTPLATLTGICSPAWLTSRSKWARFSQEQMLLSSATKPPNQQEPSRNKL